MREYIKLSGNDSIKEIAKYILSVKEDRINKNKKFEYKHYTSAYMDCVEHNKKDGKLLFNSDCEFFLRLTENPTSAVNVMVGYCIETGDSNAIKSLADDVLSTIPLNDVDKIVKSNKLIVNKQLISKSNISVMERLMNNEIAKDALHDAISESKEREGDIPNFYNDCEKEF